MDSKKQARKLVKMIVVIWLIFVLVFVLMYMGGVVSREKAVGFGIMGTVLVLILGSLFVGVTSGSTIEELEAQEDFLPLQNEVAEKISENSTEIHIVGMSLAGALSVLVAIANHYFDNPSGPIIIVGYVVIISYIVFVWRHSKK